MGRLDTHAPTGDFPQKNLRNLQSTDITVAAPVGQSNTQKVLFSLIGNNDSRVLCLSREIMSLE